MTLRPAPLALLLALGGCADRTSATAAYAPEYARLPHSTVSVLGVYRDGRMDASAWNAFAPEMARSLHADRCPAAYGDEVWPRDASPFQEQVDRSTRELGVSEEWLDQVALAARGELVLVIAEVSAEPAAPSPAQASSGAGLPDLGKGKGALLMLPLLALAALAVELVPEPTAPRYPTVDLDAMLFSRGAHRTVAEVRVHSVDASLADARRQLAAKLTSALPGLACAGWSVEAPALRDPDPGG